MIEEKKLKKITDYVSSASQGVSEIIYSRFNNLDESKKKYFIKISELMCTDDWPPSFDIDGTMLTLASLKKKGEAYHPFIFLQNSKEKMNHSIHCDSLETFFSELGKRSVTCQGKIEIQYISCIKDHWFSGMVQLAAGEPLKVFHCDSMINYLDTKFTNRIRGYLPKNAVIYYSDTLLQPGGKGCGIFALDTIAHLPKAKDNLPKRYNNDLFEYLSDPNNVTIESGHYNHQVEYNPTGIGVDVPLYLQRTLRTSKAPEIFQNKSQERASNKITKKQITPLESLKKNMISTQGKIINDRLNYKKRKMALRNIDLILTLFESGYSIEMLDETIKLTDFYAFINNLDDLSLSHGDNNILNFVEKKIEFKNVIKQFRRDPQNSGVSIKADLNDEQICAALVISALEDFENCYNNIEFLEHIMNLYQGDTSIYLLMERIFKTLSGNNQLMVSLIEMMMAKGSSENKKIFIDTLWPIILNSTNSGLQALKDLELFYTILHYDIKSENITQLIAHQAKDEAQYVKIIEFLVASYQQAGRSEVTGRKEELQCFSKRFDTDENKLFFNEISKKFQEIDLAELKRSRRRMR